MCVHISAHNNDEVPRHLCGGKSGSSAAAACIPERLAHARCTSGVPLRATRRPALPQRHNLHPLNDVGLLVFKGERRAAAVLQLHLP